MSWLEGALSQGRVGKDSYSLGRRGGRPRASTFAGENQARRDLRDRTHKGMGGGMRGRLRRTSCARACGSKVEETS